MSNSAPLLPADELARKQRKTRLVHRLVWLRVERNIARFRHKASQHLSAEIHRSMSELLEVEIVK